MRILLLFVDREQHFPLFLLLKMPAENRSKLGMGVGDCSFFPAVSPIFIIGSIKAQQILRLDHGTLDIHGNIQPAGAGTSCLGKIDGFLNRIANTIRVNQHLTILTHTGYRL